MVARSKRWGPWRGKLREDGKLHELMEGQWYAKKPEWMADDVQLALYFEAIDMLDATGEEEFEHYPVSVEAYIVVAYPGPQWMEKVLESIGGMKVEPNAEADLFHSFHYGHGVPVTHRLLGIEIPGRPIRKKRPGMVWRVTRPRFGTVAAQEGPGIEFRYPMFETFEAAYPFVEEELLPRADALMMLVGYTLDLPVNMAGDIGWQTIEEQAR